MKLQVLPPDVQTKFEKVALRNSLTTEELIARNCAVCVLIWEVIQIFELNFRHYLNREISQLSKSSSWWLDPELIHRDHLSAPSNSHDKIQFLNLGFLSLLLSDRYHKKLWVPCLQGAFNSWELPRRVLHANLRLLVRVRNRIAHHEIIYNFPLIEIVDFAQQILVDVNPIAAEELRKRNYAALINKIRLGSGGGI